MTTDTGSTSSVRTLIAELAQVEDAVRSARTFLPTNDPAGGSVLNPDLVELFKRETEIVSALRRLRHEMKRA